MLSGGAVGRRIIRTDHENWIEPVKAARTKASAATKRLDAKVTGRPQPTGFEQPESHSYISFIGLHCNNPTGPTNRGLRKVDKLEENADEFLKRVSDQMWANVYLSGGHVRQRPTNRVILAGGAGLARDPRPNGFSTTQGVVVC